MINATHFKHAFFAMVIQLLCIDFILGGAVAIAFFFGREYAQHEYWLARQDPTLTIATLRWYSPLVYRWTSDSILDVVFPVLAVIPLGVLQWVY